MEIQEVVTFSEYVRQFGPYAVPILFAAAIIQCHIPILPFAVIAAVCGFLFGFGPGMAFAWFSVIIGSSLAFGVFRSLRLDHLTQKLLSRYTLPVTDELLFGFIIVSHNIPVIPIAVPNIVAALSKISYAKFVIATGIGLFVPTVTFAAFGSGIETFIGNPGFTTMIPVILIVIIILLIRKYGSKVFHKK